MIDTYRMENQQLKQEIATLRQAILQFDPGVMYDGRFDEMVLTPITTITIARQLLEKLVNQQENQWLQ